MYAHIWLAQNLNS